MSFKSRAFTLVNKRVGSDEYAASFVNSANLRLRSAFGDPSHQLIQESTGRIWDWSTLSRSPLSKIKASVCWGEAILPRNAGAGAAAFRKMTTG
ncbi:MAG: hypothetical protein U0X76_04805 [Bacteroidia bacterium]